MTEITAIVPQQQASMILRPVVKADELIGAHKEIAVLIRDGLEDGVDYGVIPGTGGKATLLKPGAERLVKAFGCTARYEVVSHDSDHGFLNTWKDRYGKESSATGLYSYLYRCVIEKGNHLVGDGQGYASTLENKYRSRPQDCVNTVVKMAQKRALVAAVLNTFGLSGRFTQDAEDMPIVAEPEVKPAPAAPEKYEATDAQKVYFGKLINEVGIVADRDMMRKMSDICIGIEMKNLKAALVEIATDGIK